MWLRDLWEAEGNQGRGISGKGKEKGKQEMAMKESEVGFR